MANQEDIKKYLIGNDGSYLNQDTRNGQILMLSGVWGSGKTHFWKNELELKLLEKIESDNKNKSYIFISLYGKDSIEELQNEIQQLSYHFSAKDSIDIKKNPKKKNSKNIISSTFSVFTKVASFMPKVSFNAFGIGVKVDSEKTAEKLEEENIKQQIEQGVARLKNGGIICFDDFERKSSKIDLNDLFGFITNLTEVFQTKTIIITNQEFFQDNDSEVFNRIKEKSVNKFLLLNPTVDELFETIYQYKNKYEKLDEYKEKILEAIKVTEEKNARIFIQVLDNCLEYKKYVKNERDIYLLVLITVIFIKYNFIFRIELMRILRRDIILPSVVNEIPETVIQKLIYLQSYKEEVYIKEQCINDLKMQISNVYMGNKNQAQKPTEKLKDDLKYIDNHQNQIFQVYKYCVETVSFKKDEIELINEICSFIETGILLEEKC